VALQTPNAMSKTLVLYYSKTGSNRYLAEKLAKDLNADLQEIKPKINAHMLLVLLSSMNKAVPLHKLEKNPADYEKVILTTPIWMGKVISPTRAFLKKYGSVIKDFSLVSCCGSYDEVKDEKFGYNLVFNEIKSLMGNKCNSCHALPIQLVVEEDKKSNSEEIMKARLTEANFKGEILNRYNVLVKELAS
jgi:menaquinone-dependent protoporphyrinogen IX oxidase